MYDSVIVKEVDTVKMCREIVKSHGWLVGGSTGSVLQGLRQYAEQIPEGSTIVVIAPDLGSIYLATIYDNQWVNEMKASSQETTVTKQTVERELLV